MSEDFKDIKITGMNDRASNRPDPNKALFNIVLNLSAPAPYDWADYFNSRWQQHIYMQKRSASVSGGMLTIYCVPDKLEKVHIPELNKVIAETNQRYREYLSSRKIEEQRRKKEEEAEKAVLTSLKERLKFD